MARYVVRVGLDFATDEKSIARILKGEKVPWAERGMKRIEPGAVVDEKELPPRTLEYAVAKGYIEEVP